MRTRFYRLFCVALLLVVIARPALADSTSFGSIEGIVTDASGAVIPAATARARHLATGATFTASTNNEGLFWFPAAPVGTYELVVEKPGFATWVQKDVVVTVGARMNLTIALAVATAETTTTVHAETPLLETTRSEVSTTIGDSAMRGLPVNGRSFIDLVLLTPGVTRASTGSPSFEGQRGMYSLLVDGSDNNNTFGGEALGFGPQNNQYSLDTVQEFQVNTNSYSAELGRAGSGLFNVVTKSGTNDFHGGAFWYYRDRSLNANDLINKLNGQPKSPYHFNQFGGSLGGPIRKKRAFFFLGYEGQRSTAQNVVVLNLPAGFTLSPDPSVAGFQQSALAYLTARSSSWLRTFNQDLLFAKGDLYLSRHHLLTSRWNRQRFDGEGLENPGGAQVSFEHTGASLVNTDTVVTALTSTFSSTSVNVARFGYVRFNQPGRADSPNPAADILEAGQLVLTIGRNSISPRDSAIDRLEWSDTLSHSNGRHLMKAGVDFLRDQITFFTTVNFSGSYRFNSLASFGRSLAGMPAPLRGERYVQAFSGDKIPGATVHPNIFEFAGFAQDEWRLSPELTFNLGLRYDLETLARPPVRNPSPALAAFGLDTSSVPTDSDNFAPRLGFAWAPLRNRLFLRGGYGIFYARTPSVMSSRAHFQNGLTVQTRTFLGGTPTAGLIPAYPNTLCGPPDPSGTPPSCAAPASGAGSPLLMMFDPRYTWPAVHQGSFGIEVQLQKDMALSASYLWVHGTHFQRLRDVNLGTSTSATIPIANTDTILTYLRFNSRPIPGFDRVFLFESNASSNYHGLAVQITRRFADNLQFLGSYTLSKVIDDKPDSGAINPPATDGLLVQDASNPRADRSRGATDQRHRFVFSGIWDLHYADRLPSAARAALRGWQVGGILTAQSGQPYSGLINFDLNNDGNFANDQTPGLGRNTFTLPSTVSLDTRLTRTFPLKNERARLEFSWEAFNVFNHGNVTAVRTQQFAVSTNVVLCGAGVPQCLIPLVIGLTAFGTPTSSSGPRIMQLAARFVF
jgi:outer membrane receptor protein involved in Fe transport